VIEDGKKLKGACGTPNYIAPEILLGIIYFAFNRNLI